MTTIGDLTLNDIGKTRIIVQHEGATVSGLLGNLSPNVETETIRGGAETIVHRTIWHVTIDIQIGSISLDGLNRDHPCEVIA